MENKWLNPSQVEIIVYELENLVISIWKILKKLPRQYHSIDDFNYLLIKNYDWEKRK